MSSLIGSFYNCLSESRKTKDAFVDDLQIVMHKIVACKPEFMKEANQALKQQYMHSLHLFLGNKTGTILGIPRVP